MAHTTNTKGAELLRQLTAPGGESTQADVARACDVTPAAVSNWALGHAVPRAEYLAVMEDKFGIPMRAWTERGRNRPPKGAT